MQLGLCCPCGHKLDLSLAGCGLIMVMPVMPKRTSSSQCQSNRLDFPWPHDISRSLREMFHWANRFSKIRQNFARVGFKEHTPYIHELLHIANTNKAPWGNKSTVFLRLVNKASCQECGLRTHVVAKSLLLGKHALIIAVSSSQRTRWKQLSAGLVSMYCKVRVAVVEPNPGHPSWLLNWRSTHFESAYSVVA